MAEIHVSAERRVAAPADRVYRYIADYRVHRPRWLPPNITNFHVESGGTGAGTVASYHLTTGKRERDYRVQVSEPERGRVLTESDTKSSLVTMFTVTPDGETSTVRMDTRWKGSGGIGGFFERTFAPRVLQRIYEDELDRLDMYARAQSG